MRAWMLRSQVPNSIPTTVTLLLPELAALPGDTARTTARLYDNAADRAPDACKPALELKDTADSAEPESLHKIDDSAIHRETSQDVWPALSPTLYPALPNLRPVTVTLLPPVDAALFNRTELKLGTAKLTPKLKLPVCRMADTTVCSGLPTPRETRHATTLSAAHAELIVEDAPIRPLALAPIAPIERPKTSTIDAPDTATSSKLTLETIALSKLKANVTLPTCTPTETNTDAPAPRPAMQRATTLLPPIHMVPEAALKPMRAPALAP
jgi:hypothetical protein